MPNTTNLGIALLAQNQAQKEVTANEAFSKIDAILNRGVIDKDLATPPGSPSEGDLYIVAASPTGAWTSHAGHLAYYNSGWKFITPNEGMTLWVNDEDFTYTFNSSSWIQSGVSVSSATTNEILQHNGTKFVNRSYFDSLSKVGINTTSDTTNKLAVKSDAVLFDHNGTTSQVKINKNATANTASHLFQVGYSGRAEFGLIASDNYELKVSSDGSSWNQSYVVTNSTGDIDFKQNVNVTGNLTGVALNDLDDAVITSPANGEVLKYNGSNWVNGTVAGASNTLAALDDVTITSAADNDFLVHNGTDWVNEAASTARTSMGLGSIATQAASSVAVTGGAIDGTTIGATTATSGKFTTIDASSTLTMNDNELVRTKLKDYAETKTAPSSSSGSLTLNLENGNVFEVTLTENVSSTTFSNPPASGSGGSFTLILKQDGTGGRTFVWPAAVDWAGGTAPTLTTTASAVDILTFLTVDAGTRWYGFLAGSDMQ